MRLFVYGSLLEGEYNHPVLMQEFGAVALGPARTKPEWTMAHVNPHFPGCVPGGGAVVGELYEVEENVRDDLDVLEGHPELYLRTDVELADGGVAWMYVYRHSIQGMGLVPNNDWRAFQTARTEGKKHGIGND